MQIDLVSDVFDTYMFLFSGSTLDDVIDENILHVDDDSGVDANSQLALELAAGSYLVAVRGFSGDAQGAYNLTLAAEVIGDDEDEAGALTIAASTPAAGGLFPEGDEDLYTFVGDAGQIVDVALSSAEFDAYLQLEFNGEVIAANDDGGGGRNALVDDFVLPVSGQYTVRVRSFSRGESGFYELALAQLESPFTLVGQVGAGAYEGAVVAGAIDFYAFELTAFSQVQLDLVSEEFDAFLVLYEGSVLGDRRAENRLRSDDDGGGLLNSQIAAELPAGTIAADSTNGVLLEGGQIHLYPWVLESLSQVQVDLVSTDFDAYLVIYEGSTAADRSSAHELGADDDGGGGLNAQLSGVLEAGSYLIEVRSFASAATGTYALVTTAAAIEGDEDDPLPISVAYGATAVGRVFPVADVDRYTFSGVAGDVVDIALDSEDFDAYVELLLDGKVIAEDDDGGPDLNSLIEDTVLPVSGQYQVRVSALAENIGAYELGISDNSAALALGDTLTTGNISGEIERAGQVRLYPFVLAERSQVQLRLVASQLAGELDLFGGGGIGDRQTDNRIATATTGEVGSALIDRPLAAGTYLVEVRAAADEAGPFGLELKVESLSGQVRDRIAFAAGEINGAALNAFSPQVVVKPGEKISGTLSLSILNSHATSDVFPVGATPTWGASRSSYWLVEDWASPGESTHALSVELEAPQEPGTYYVLVVGAAESSVENILSGTHGPSRATPIWGDNDDVAAWSQTQIDHAVANGWTSVEWFENYQTDIGAFALEIIVSEEAGLPRGPISFDLDHSAGDQRLRQRQIDATGDTVAVELYIKDAPEINGWSARIEYDPMQLIYTSGSFSASDFIPGLIILVDEKSNYIEIGGTVLGSTDSNSGDGMLAALSFVVQDGFSQSTSLAITQVSLRTPSEGRTKEQVRSLATLSRAVEIESGPITLDFDIATEDQGQRLLQGVEAGQQIAVQLHVSTAPEISGWSARIEYDPAQLGYVSGSFNPSTFISGIVPLVSEKEGRLDLGGTVLGGNTANAGDGVLGTATFVALPGFAERSDLVVTRVSFNTLASGEIIQITHAVATLSAEPLAPEVAGDFSGDAQVDFSDFFLFADHFGSSEADTGWDPLYDLNDDGEVDFSDFFVFADYFNGAERGKLMELAREHIGLPTAAVLEQNFPNPFNASTLVRYVVATAGPVRLQVYDINGQRIVSLVEGIRPAGVHEVRWHGLDKHGRDAASGVYFYMLRAGETTQVRKMLYLR